MIPPFLPVMLPLLQLRLYFSLAQAFCPVVSNKCGPHPATVLTKVHHLHWAVLVYAEGAPGTTDELHALPVDHHGA